MNEGIIGLDEQKRIIFVNKRSLDILKLEKQGIIGEYAADIAAKNELMRSLISELMIGLIKDKENTYKPLKVVDNGKERLFSKNIVDVVIKPTGENREILIGHVIILSDITAFAERDRARTLFMATISHELKTPVSAIQMSVMLLKNEKSGVLNNEQLQLLETIEANNARVMHTINEVLDLSQIESGMIDINLSEVNVEDIIQRSLGGVSIFLKDKDIKVKKDVEPSDSLIKVDAHKTVWILNNFLMNAIRYAPDGTTIEVNSKTAGNFMKISVTDAGPGIAKEDQEKVFDKFTRLDKSSMSGTGLGLAISKEFIEAMGGTIGVDSEIGAGAVFWIKCAKV